MFTQAGCFPCAAVVKSVYETQDVKKMFMFCVGQWNNVMSTSFRFVPLCVHYFVHIFVCLLLRDVKSHVVLQKPGRGA